MTRTFNYSIWWDIVFHRLKVKNNLHISLKIRWIIQNCDKNIRIYLGMLWSNPPRIGVRDLPVNFPSLGLVAEILIIPIGCWCWLDNLAIFLTDPYHLALFLHNIESAIDFTDLLNDHFMNALSQWEMMLHCNVISHWLSTCTNDPCSWQTLPTKHVDRQNFWKLLLIFSSQYTVFHNTGHYIGFDTLKLIRTY